MASYGARWMYSSSVTSDASQVSICEFESTYVVCRFKRRVYAFNNLIETSLLLAAVDGDSLSCRRHSAEQSTVCTFAASLDSAATFGGVCYAAGSCPGFCISSGRLDQACRPRVVRGRSGLDAGYMTLRAAAVAVFPVFGVPCGSIRSMWASSSATGRCSTPLGTTNISPGPSLTAPSLS